jgi:putative glutamine amidotransferase
MGSEAKLQLYFDWLLSGDPTLEPVQISYALDNVDEISSSDGVLLTGGGDVDPALYHRTSGHPKIYGVDPKRDTFECSVLHRVLKEKKPLLGICRGLQITNVYFGGTLVVDLSEAGKSGHDGDVSQERRHNVHVAQDGLLHNIVGVESGEVNSFHHQAAQFPGKGLVVCASSPDGVTEAMELERPDASLFFLLVQWHPERMKDLKNPFCGNILRAFLGAARKFGAAPVLAPQKNLFNN